MYNQVNTTYLVKVTQLWFMYTSTLHPCFLYYKCFALQQTIFYYKYL